MTLSAFIKQLQKLEAAGHGRAKVTVNKDTLWDGNGTYTILDIHGAVADSIRQVDGDGFGIVNQDGTERKKSCIVLLGQWADEHPVATWTETPGEVMR